MVGEFIRSARLLDQEISLACPICANVGEWSGGVPEQLFSWRGLPAARNGVDHSVSASRAYMAHLEAEHGVVDTDLVWSQLPMVVDSPRTRSTQFVWLVNQIVDRLVTRRLLTEDNMREALEISAQVLTEVVSCKGDCALVCVASYCDHFIRNKVMAESRDQGVHISGVDLKWSACL